MKNFSYKNKIRITIIVAAFLIAASILLAKTDPPPQSAYIRNGIEFGCLSPIVPVLRSLGEEGLAKAITFLLFYFTG